MTANINKNGPADMVSYLKQFNLPIASEGVWEENGFDVQSLFNFDAGLAFGLFFDFEIVNCIDKVMFPALCTQAVESWKYNSNIRQDMMSIMEVLKADEQLIETAVYDFEEFLERKLASQGEHFIDRYGSEVEEIDLEEDLAELSWKGIYRNYLIHCGFDPSKLLVQKFSSIALSNSLSKMFEKLPKR